MEFLNEFNLNKKYVFDKDIYIEHAMLYGEYTGKDFAEELWTDTCHNKTVTVTNKGNACIGNYSIIPEWCREVPSIRLLTENDL